jgi:hypothetical protein
MVNKQKLIDKTELTGSSSQETAANFISHMKRNLKKNHLNKF